MRRDGTMRTELEALLLYAAPRELLIAEPLSSATAKMLGAFVSASAGVRAETVQRDTYRDGGARAAVVAFYGEEGAPSGPQPVCASRVRAILCVWNPHMHQHRKPCAILDAAAAFRS